MGLCLCVSVCHPPVLYRDGCTDRAGFWHTELPLTYPTMYFKEIRVSPKNKGTSVWNFVQNFGRIKFGHGTFTVAEYDKLSIVVGLVLTAIDDGGRGQVSSTVDRLPSPADYIQHPALCLAQRAIRRAAARRASPSASAETCSQSSVATFLG